MKCFLAPKGIIIYTLGLVIVMPAGSLAQTNTETKGKVRFRPQTTAASGVRVTGGSRGTGETTTSLDVLAPDEVGLTTQAQPSLYWYQSKPFKGGLEVTVLQESKPKPILRVNMDQGGKPGIQRVRLADHGVKLEKGTEYQWVVALVSDRENRSTDLVASGAIKRVDPSGELERKLAGKAPEAAAGVYAEEGVWYDAFAALSDGIDAHPDDTALRSARADLLRQVGLKGVASAEESAAK